MNEYVALSYLQVGLAAVLIIVNGAVSLLLQLGLTRTLLIASLRTIVQLLLIGWVLQWIFSSQHPLVVLATAAMMTVIAGLSARSRLSHGYAWMWMDTCVSMWISSWSVALYALLFVVDGMDPWYRPQHAIPLLGMILGNTLNGISIGLDAMLQSLTQSRRLIEMRLAHGATGWEATRPERRSAVKSGMMPIINAMMVVGLVNLPGMMTGQLLSGTSPVEAVKYQIAIMFLIASATAVGTVTATLLCFARLVNHHHQLRVDKLRTR